MIAWPDPRASTLIGRVEFPSGTTRDVSTPEEMTTMVRRPEVTSLLAESTSRTRFPVSKL